MSWKFKFWKYIRFYLNFEERYSEKKDSYLVLIFERQWQSSFSNLKYYKCSIVLSISDLQLITVICLFNFIEINDLSQISLKVIIQEQPLWHSFLLLFLKIIEKYPYTY